MKTLRLILGDQLNASHSWFRQKSGDVIYLIAELHQEQHYVTHHIQKVCAFFAAMEGFAKALRTAGHKVEHLNLDESQSFNSLPELIVAMLNKHKIETFEYQLPDEYRLREQLAAASPEFGVKVTVYETEHFYLSESELPECFKPGVAHRLEHFYRKMRVKHQVLMNGEEPEGGQWNYDKSNRNKLKADDLQQVPEPLTFSTQVGAIVERIRRHNIKTIGEVGDVLLWPVNRNQAIELLDFFCQVCLPKFGQFQDALTGKLRVLSDDKGWSLYHSRLSFAINAKILSPRLVVNKVVGHYQHNKNSIDIAQVEGFVRQILGWREFVRGIYWANSPSYQSLNHLNATRALPSWFWTGKTKMQCMSHAISQSLQFSYAHHIQRLMVTGNFCLLIGAHPDEVDAWYLGIYIDAIEWVEMPNTRGMSQFADGGIVGSKAYAASGNYINKMSDYCGECHYQVKHSSGDKACPMNSLYWHFMDRNESLMGNNPRNAMVYKNWHKKPESDRQAILQQAEQYLIHIEQL